MARFRDLPPELRTKIWKESLPETHQIKIYAAPVQTNEPVGHGDSESFAFTEWRYTLSILSVCYESRQVALSEGYQPFWGGFTKPVFLNASRDTLWFENAEVLEDYLGSSFEESFVSNDKLLGVSTEDRAEVQLVNNVQVPALAFSIGAEKIPSRRLMDIAQRIIQRKGGYFGCHGRRFTLREICLRCDERDEELERCIIEWYREWMGSELCVFGEGNNVPGVPRLTFSYAN